VRRSRRRRRRRGYRGRRGEDAQSAHQLPCDFCLALVMQLIYEQQPLNVHVTPPHNVERVIELLLGKCQFHLLHVNCLEELLGMANRRTRRR
jgi:hypothetical protein